MAVEREDLRECSDQELSLQVFNDEGLYEMRRDLHLTIYLETLFIFTPKQLEVLNQDLEAEEKGELVDILFEDFERMFSDADRATKLELLERLNRLEIKDLKLLARGVNK